MYQTCITKALNIICFFRPILKVHFLFSCFSLLRIALLHYCRALLLPRRATLGPAFAQLCLSSPCSAFALPRLAKLRLCFAMPCFVKHFYAMLHLCRHGRCSALPCCALLHSALLLHRIVALSRALPLPRTALQSFAQKGNAFALLRLTMRGSAYPLHCVAGQGRAIARRGGAWLHHAPLLQGLCRVFTPYYLLCPCLSLPCAAG